MEEKIIRLLLRKAVKNGEITSAEVNDLSKPEVRTAYGKYSGLVGIFLNLIMAAGKLIAGIVSGAVSVTADAVNNISDAASSIISLIGFKLASKPADDEHPYGHGRYEYLSGLTVSILIIIIGIELLKTSIDRTINPTEVIFGYLSGAILALSIIVKLFMVFFYMRIGKKINSTAVTATCADCRNDIITTSAILCAGIISRFVPFELDGIVGIVVAVYILISGFRLVVQTIDPMLGKAPDPDFVKQIHDTIMSYPGVLGTHDLMIHDYGPGRTFAGVHVEMAAEDDVLESHDVIDNIERNLLATMGIHIIVHFDPILTKDSAANDFRCWLAEEVKIIDQSLTIHDLRMVKGPTHTNVIFDCVMTGSLADVMSTGELKAAISALVKKTYPTYYCVITVDRSYASLPH